MTQPDLERSGPMGSYLRRNIFAVIFLAISFILLALLYYKSSQLDDVNGRLNQMQQEIARLQDDKLRLMEEITEQKKKLVEYEQREELRKGLPAFITK